MIPWVLSDTNYVRGPHQRLDTSWTVFVGGLHGMLNAGKLNDKEYFAANVRLWSVEPSVFLSVTCLSLY